jgi:hypothetical protein
MAIDPSKFHPSNVADTCAVWNVLSSTLLFRRATLAGCTFCCTQYVIYECLYKHRTMPKDSDNELRRRLQSVAAKHFKTCELDIADLQNVELLKQRKRLGMGEISSIAFAMKTNLAFLTDDQKARKLALCVLEPARVQTTPHLFGWLFFTARLSDADKATIIAEHEAMDGILTKYLEAMYMESLHYRLLARRPLSGTGN